MRSLCIYCGSSLGAQPHYRAVASRTGRLLAERGVTLVYGAGNAGLMGALADAVLAAGGRAIGAIPQLFVDLDLAHRGLHDLHVVDTMHERKALMARLSDAFMALPGGIGTLEELAEIMTWRQLEIHRKPLGLLNHHGFYDSLLAFLDTAVREGFLPQAHRDLVIVAETPERLLDALAAACMAPPPGAAPSASPAPGG